MKNYICNILQISVADPGGQGGHGPLPWPAKNSHKKDGRIMRQLIFHVSCPPPSEVSGSATHYKVDVFQIAPCPGALRSHGLRERNLVFDLRLTQMLE